MFSGIIDAVGQVRSCRETPGGKTLVVAARDYWAESPAGASIAVDGVCLTLTSIRDSDATFDVITETLRRSTLGGLRPGDRVNLQKALAVGDRVDGHFVQGHVDAVGTVAKVEQSPGESIWWFSSHAETLAYTAPKGSIAIDGISLTIVDVHKDMFSVALIPTTLERTTLGQKNVGDPVNIETDILARTVVHYLQSFGGPRGAAEKAVTLESLRRQGFA
jgi:riboflavin synthase